MLPWFRLWCPAGPAAPWRQIGRDWLGRTGLLQRQFRRQNRCPVPRKQFSLECPCRLKPLRACCSNIRAPSRSTWSRRHYVLVRSVRVHSRTGCSPNAKFSSGARFRPKKKSERAWCSVKRSKPPIEWQNARESCMLARRKPVYWSTCSLDFLCRRGRGSGPIFRRAGTSGRASQPRRPWQPNPGCREDWRSCPRASAEKFRSVLPRQRADSI